MFGAFLFTTCFIASSDNHFLIIFFLFFAIKNFIRGVLEYTYKREEKGHFIFPNDRYARVADRYVYVFYLR
ncbi:hypothetical protein [Metabacillus iocasae]|uniref:hypothetical protein n=1 Tax=Priestia iocasae TaxID=2291674 RepID=UPI0035EB70F9